MPLCFYAFCAFECANCFFAFFPLSSHCFISCYRLGSTLFSPRPLPLGHSPSTVFLLVSQRSYTFQLVSTSSRKIPTKTRVRRITLYARGKRQAEGLKNRRPRPKTKPSSTATLQRRKTFISLYPASISTSGATQQPRTIKEQPFLAWSGLHPGQNKTRRKKKERRNEQGKK